MPLSTIERQRQQHSAHQHEVEYLDRQNDQNDAAILESGKEDYNRLCLNLQYGWDAKATEFASEARTKADKVAHEHWEKLKGSSMAGFTYSIRAGPICEEPIRNVLVIIEGIEIATTPAAQDQDVHCSPDVSGGKVVAAMRPGIRCALLTRPARLMESMLRLTLHSSLAALGALYKVLSQRRGKVIEDSMVDGTDLLEITALLPQAESFGFAPQVFRETSGEVTAPNLVFSHWQRLDVDPFWIPTSLEEREDYGELVVAGDSSTGIDNTALLYIRKVRQRKGLRTDAGRTVLAAEKQRTLKR